MGTNPHDADSDDNGDPDGVDDPDDDGESDGNEDPDNDGRFNEQEIDLDGTDPQIALVAIEHRLWNAWETSNGEIFAEHISEQSLTIISEEVITKSALLEMIANNSCEVRNWKNIDPKVYRLSKTTAILTFHGFQDAVCDGEELPSFVL